MEAPHKTPDPDSRAKEPEDKSADLQLMKQLIVHHDRGRKKTTEPIESGGARGEEE